VKRFLEETKKRLLSGELDDWLWVMKSVSKDLRSYDHKPPHVRAAELLEKNGVAVRAGDKVRFIWTGKRVIVQREKLSYGDRLAVWEKFVEPIIERLGVGVNVCRRMDDFLRKV